MARPATLAPRALRATPGRRPTGRLLPTAVICLLTALPAWAQLKADPVKAVRVQELDTQLAPGAALLAPALAWTEPAAAGQSYAFFRVTPSGASEALSAPAAARPAFGLNGELAGVIVQAGDVQTLHAWDENGVERWAAALPPRQTGYILPGGGYVIIGDGRTPCMDSPARMQFFGFDGTPLGAFEADGEVIVQIAGGPTGLVAAFIGDRNGRTDNALVLLAGDGRLLARQVLAGSRSRFGVAGLSVGPNGAAGVAMIRSDETSPAAPTLFVLRADGAIASQPLEPELGGQPTWVDAERVALLGTRRVRVWDAKTNAWDGREVATPGFALARQARLLGRNLILLSSDEGAVALHARSLDTGAELLDRSLPNVKPDVGRDLLSTRADGVLLLAGSERLLITAGGVQ